jgi:hypothetical protein
MEGEEAAMTAALPIFPTSRISLLLFGFTSCSFDVRIFGNRAMMEPQSSRRFCCIDIIFRQSLAALQTRRQGRCSFFHFSFAVVHI